MSWNRRYGQWSCPEKKHERTNLSSKRVHDHHHVRSRCTSFFFIVDASQSSPLASNANNFSFSRFFFWKRQVGFSSDVKCRFFVITVPPMGECLTARSHIQPRRNASPICVVKEREKRCTMPSLLRPAHSTATAMPSTRPKARYDNTGNIVTTSSSTGVATELSTTQKLRALRRSLLSQHQLTAVQLLATIPATPERR